VWVERRINQQKKKRRTLLCCSGRLVQNFTILLFYDVSHYDRYHSNQALCKQFKHNLLIVFLYFFALETKYFLVVLKADTHYISSFSTTS
jgi:hypothetical protein